jgi:hypothetical protein
MSRLYFLLRFLLRFGVPDVLDRIVFGIKILGKEAFILING